MKKNKWTPKKIKELRSKLGLTQDAFSKLIGVHIIYISYLETGKRNPSRPLQLLMDSIEEKNINT